MAIESTLNKLGFNQKEIDVYLALLQFGASSMTGIANQTKLKRPTCYLVIENLLKRGLISIIKKGSTTLYLAERPKKILSLLKSHEQELEQTLPELEALYNSPKHKPKIYILEGKEGLQKINESLVNYFNSRNKEKVLIIKSDVDIAKQNSVIYKEFLSNIEKINKKQINKLNNPNPSSSNNVIAFENKVIFFSLKTNIYLTIIEDENIYQTILSLFTKQ